ncbi:zinc finger protein rotund isoform X2 [Lucilia cuprina]|uniref:zinc finger protein rotund isoform X2 n=1 Tax=Lucilia cuprina TaxID=7375 RepID=UPI001F054C02|nr:zinc finger protein rotund isoform X2 [Lucilia cuprina]
MLSPCSQSHSPSNSLTTSCLVQPTKMPLKAQKSSYNSYKPNCHSATAATPFLMPAEFYKSLFATAVLHHSNNINNDAHHHQQHHHHNQQHHVNPDNFSRTQTQSHLAETRYLKSNTTAASTSSATPPVAYGSSLSSATTAAASSSYVANANSTHFSRNLLFSSSAAAVAAMAESVKRSHANEKKPTNYIWPAASSEAEANNNTITDSVHLTNPATPPTPPPDTHLNLEHPSKSYNNSLKPIDETDLIEQQQHQHQEITQSHKSLKHKQTAVVTTTTSSSSSSDNHLGNGSNMPIGGVQGQNPTQGLVHWMSAVMAEHMTGQTHHDPTAVGMHYMWNGNVDAKMNDHHNNLQKGHFIDDNRLEHHAVTPQGGSVLGSAGGGHHGNHVGHHSSASAAALLVVPQPINATKIGSSLGGSGGGGGGGTGRKYQCKMCPQIFTSKADLQLHTQMHMRESKPYKCTQCSKAFANSSYLSQHTRIHLGIKPYRCEICQRKFTQLSHLQQHIRTHTGDKPYKCRHPGCQKAFSQLSNLQSHSRCHQTDKPFKCNSCYKCFSDEASLLDHIPKHKESKHLKTHICQYCGKSYTQETYLNKHMQKHSERTDKRPPIVATNAGSNSATGTGTAGVGGGGSGGGGGHPGTGNQHNRNNISLPPVTIAPTDNSYWPKVSPDSAANMNDVMHQQQPQQQQQHSHQQHHQQQQQQAHNGQQPTQQQQQHHHPQQTNTQQQPPTQQQGQTHMDYTNHQASGANNPHNDLQNHHRMNDTGREDIVSTPSTVGPYDASSITKTTTNSAFTPINSMPPHLNTLSHHAMSQRPYLYDAISFQNKNVNQNNASNSFPNQLISLHQIRNYAHQPAGLTMAGEHLLGVSVGPGKDKG